MEAIIYICVGAIIGCVLGRIIYRTKLVGTLRVDQSDPNSGPYLFMELSRQGVVAIQKKKYVLFKVDLKSYIPHE